MKTTLEKRIVVFAFLVLTVTIAVNSGFNIENFRRHYREGVLLRLDSVAAGLQRSIEEKLRQGMGLARMAGLDGRCRQIVAGDPELAYCLIENELGEPLFAHDPSFGATARIGFVTSEGDKVTILDIPPFGHVFDLSLPLSMADGTLVGRVRLGFPQSILDHRSDKMLQQSLAVLGCAFLAVFALVVFAARRDLVAPIRRLCTVAREISGENFKPIVPPMPNREFTELADALQSMAGSLQQRQDEISKGYRELEEANRLLQQSYAAQEKISSDLARSEKMHLALFENASDAIVISDHETRIILFNRQAEEFFGLPREAVIGRSLFRTIERVRGDQRLHQQFYRALLENGRHQAELRYVRLGDDQPLVGQVHASVAHDREGKFWAQMVIHDITRELKVKENLERCARDMERLNQMKNTFLGLASHELKTPLTILVGYSDLILSGGGGPISDPVREMVQHIGHAADRLTGIVRDMIDVSMLDNQRLALKLQSVDINLAVRQVVATNAPSLSHRQQTIELMLAEELTAVEGDPDRLRQALDCLLGNAIKFTPDGGRISIETRHFTPLREQPGPLEAKVEIVIRDTGIGIADQDRPHVFDKFFEGGEIEFHSTGKVAFQGRGAGLGLTIARGIIELHGGRIWVESPGHDPDQCPGSTFHALLPVFQGGRNTV